MTVGSARLLIVAGEEGVREAGPGGGGSVTHTLGRWGYDVTSIPAPTGSRWGAISGALAATRRIPSSEGVVITSDAAPVRGLALLLRVCRWVGTPTVLVHGRPDDPAPGRSSRGRALLASRVVRGPDATGSGLLLALDQVGLRRAPAPSSGIAPLALRDLEAVAALHADAFPASGMTLLGLPTVRRYYEWQLIGPHPAPLALGAWRGGRLVGLVVGGVRHKAVAGFAARSLGTIAWGACTHPVALRRLGFPQVTKIARLMARRPPLLRPPAEQAPAADTDLVTPPSFGILSLAVAPASQGSGVARELMDEARARARELGFDRMHLTVEVGNDRAIAFYERAGWTRERVGGEWGGRMICELR